jgi:uncharacterized protein (TIGR00369 family)
MAGLPMLALFGVEVTHADPASAIIKLSDGPHITRPGGSVAGPVLFAMADVAAYALILAFRPDPHSVTVDLTIHFLRPALKLPLIAVATPLRAGRRLFTAEIVISAEAEPDRKLVHATATYALS